MFENLQKTIDSFIGIYGTETLIQYLENFEQLHSKKYYTYIENLCKEVAILCEVKQNSILDINNTNRNVVDARRHIVYFITIDLKLPNKIITTLFNCKLRTVYKYQREVKDRLRNKHIYKEYSKIHNQIKKEINVPTYY